MSATIIDGRVVANRMQADIVKEVDEFRSSYGYSPGLGVVLVGDDQASHMYVRMKRRACEKVGMESVAQVLPSEVSQREVEEVVQNMNSNRKIHGILVQLPLPNHIDEQAVLSAVSLNKDVDGFHPINIGLLAMKDRDPKFTPATPTGCMELLKDSGVQIEGANAVVIGRSNIVGLPMALLLMQANATVTVTHSRTQNLPEIVNQADIVVAAIGKPNFVQADWLKPGCTVIDVGSNVVDAPETEKGYKYVGDVDFQQAVDVAGAITKVPGGVGPMTITMLLSNTMKAAWNLA